MSFSPHAVYARCLLGDHGYPLWTPQLNTELRETYQLEGLKIGDVGVVSPIDGSFDVLLNITLPRSEQPYPRLVREDFAPVVLDHELDLASRPDAVSAHGVIPSASVQLTSKDINDHEQAPSSANYEFSLSTGRGAVLVLPEGAQSCDLRNENKFLDQAIQHGLDWYECATKEAGRLINNDSLYLVTGFHKTRSWSLGAAERSDPSIQDRRSVTFKVERVHQGSVTARGYLWLATHGFTGRVGPMYPYELVERVPPGSVRVGVNQTVFIRGFRITVNKLLFLKTVSVKTRQGTFFGLRTRLDKLLSHRKSRSTLEDATDNTVDQDYSVNQLHADRCVTIERVPEVPLTFHPGDMINQYMLKKEPGAKIAITHDSQRIQMLKKGLVTLDDFARESTLAEVLSKHYRVIPRRGGVFLLEHDTDKTGGRIVDSGIALVDDDANANNM